MATILVKSRLVLAVSVSVSQKTTPAATDWLHHHIDKRTRY